MPLPFALIARAGLRFGLLPGQSAGGMSAASLYRQVEIDVTGSMEPILHDLDREVRDKLVPQATAYALNRTARSLRARITRQVSEILKVKAGLIRRRIRIVKASRHKARAVLRFLVGPISAYIAGGRQNKAGVRVGRRGTIPSAFVASARGKRHVFKRSGAKAYPIRIQTIPILPQGDQVAVRVVQLEGPALFRKEFERDLQRRLRKIGRPSRRRF